MDLTGWTLKEARATPLWPIPLVRVYLINNATVVGCRLKTIGNACKRAELGECEGAKSLHDAFLGQADNGKFDANTMM